MAQKPPKTKTKLSPEARAEIGKPRACVECEEIKPLDSQHYAPSKRPGRSLRGWATTCRVCQGVAASTKGVRSKEQVNHLKAIHTTDSSLIQEMYDCGPQEYERQEEIAKYFHQRLEDMEDREGFELFIRIVSPLIAGWREPGAIHEDIKDGLCTTHNRALIIATRYSAKSTLTAIYVAWKIYRDPMVKVMVISRGAPLAKRMLRVVRQVIIGNCPLMREYIPDEDCLDNAEQFQVPQTLAVATGGVTFSSFGITSNIVGNRADITIGDDVEGTADDTPEKVEELDEKLNELSMINPRGRIILLGTYQTEYSLYAKKADLVDSDGTPVWEMHRACMFEESLDDKGKVTIHSRWPEMFSDKDGLDWRRAVTQRAWRLHILLIADPSILNEKPLKIRDFILVNHGPMEKKFPIMMEPGGPAADPDMPRWAAPKGDDWKLPLSVSEDVGTYAVTIAAVDPASGLAGRDAIGVAILSVTPGGLGVVRHLEGVRAHNKALAMRRVATIIRDFEASTIIVEETEESFFGATLENELVTLAYPMSTEKVSHGGMNKGKRIIDALAPPMGAGRIVMLEAVARSDHGGEFVNQMVRISYDGRTGTSRKDHDDIVDALAHAVAKVKGSLISDTADNLAAFHVEKLEAWRHLPLHKGGLGGVVDADLEGGHKTVRIANPEGRGISSGDTYQLSMAEALIEEDEVLISIQERRDRLQATLRTDQAIGRDPDYSVINRIKVLTEQIEQLKSHQVL